MMKQMPELELASGVQQHPLLYHNHKYRLEHRPPPQQTSQSIAIDLDYLIELGDKSLLLKITYA